MRQNTHPPATDLSSLGIPATPAAAHVLDPGANNPHQLPLCLEPLPSPRNNRHLRIRVDTHCPARLLADREEFGKDWEEGLLPVIRVKAGERGVTVDTRGIAKRRAREKVD
jgi:hypothetical protein